MDQNTIKVLAQKLRHAELKSIAIDPLTATHPNMTVADAYAIQRVVMEDRVTAGNAVIGKKVGLTSKAMQNFLQVSEPDFGHLHTDMLFDEEFAIPVSRFIQPKVEAEIAFVLSEDLKGPGVTMLDVLRCSAGVIPAFEIIDSRIANWKIKIQDTIADNGSSAGLVLGSKLIPVDAINLKHVGLVLEKNGAILETAAGAAVMGHPAQAVAWLANALGNMDLPLRKGEIILSGSFTKAFEVKKGDCFMATFGGIGSVKILFE